MASPHVLLFNDDGSWSLGIPAPDIVRGTRLRCTLCRERFDQHDDYEKHYILKHLDEEI